MKPIVPYMKSKKHEMSFSNFISARNKTSQIGRRKYYLFDSFKRADSVVDLGNAETDSAPYTYSSAGTGVVWGIQNNSAYIVSATTAGRSLAYKELNESDCLIEVNMTSLNINNGVALRIVDNNNFIYCVVQPTFLSLNKYVSGTASTIQSVSKNFTNCRLSVVVKGNKIEVYVDGFLMIRAYDSFNSTATKHGLFSRADGLGTLWSDLSVKPVSEVPFYLNEGFENSLSSWYWGRETAGLSYSQTFDTTIKKRENKSLRIELHKDDPDVSGSKRCEITLPSENGLEEHWYGISIYLPNGGVDDYALDPSPESLIQWHSMPDSGEAYVSPPLSLQTQNGRYLIVLNSDEGRMSTATPLSLTQTFTDIGDYTADKGKWVDWVFHVKWGYSSIHEPITEVYKNGVLVYQNNGVPNMTNDQLGVYTKIGIYKWEWHYTPEHSVTTKRVVYYDDFWMK